MLTFEIFSFPRRMFETTRECTLTKVLVCSMITIRENATQMTPMKWILGAIVRSKSIRIFHFLTLSMPHVTIAMISHLVQKVPLQELLSATEFSVRMV